VSLRERYWAATKTRLILLIPTTIPLPPLLLQQLGGKVGEI